MTIASLTSPLLNQLNIRHGFFTRQGGVSTGLYTSLNCGLGSADDRKAVIANRNAVTRSLGANNLITVNQVHSTVAVLVDKPFEIVPDADALVTTTPGIAIGVLTADCAPVLFASEDGSVIGAAHAGWKGALGGIIENTLSLMESVGAKDIHAYIGPCIGLLSYEVGLDFLDRFLEVDENLAVFFIPSLDRKRFRFDLAGFIDSRLCGRVVGISAYRRDTYAEPETFFSYRRATHAGEADYGRQISAITIGI